MNYPLISEYIEAIKSAEDNFEELSYLRPVLGDDGLPVMTSGNFAVVFKMKDEQSGKLYAVKCFTKDQEGRAEAYREIAKELKDVSSPYLVSIRYMEKELFVDTDQTIESEFPVLLMDWVEGQTLDKYIRENLKNIFLLESLVYRFSQMAHWLIAQSFAHGDLKPDNILVRKDGQLVLVDYDGMYVPAMKGQKARELGSPDFRHPQRTETDFDEHIDDFPIISVLLSLKAISIRPHLLKEFGEEGRLLLSHNDYEDISQCDLAKELFPSEDKYLNALLCLFTLLLDNFISVKFRDGSFDLLLPYTDLNERGVVCRIYRLPRFSKDKPYVRVVFKRRWCNATEYLVTYNLRLIYEKECVDDVGNFDCNRAFKLFTNEMPIGSLETINLYDISINEISDCMLLGSIKIDMDCILERKTYNKVKFIPVATYENKEKAILIAKKILEEELLSPFGRYIRITQKKN